MENIKELKIKKGFYWTVGKRFGWREKGHSNEGIGVARSYFDSDRIIITVDEVKYIVQSKEALDFIKETESWEVMDGVKVGYIPKTMMKKYEA